MTSSLSPDFYTRSNFESDEIVIMSAAIGIKAQPSRFAVLMKDSDSDDNESELKTKPRPNSKGVTKPNKKSEPAALKNAKKRARKKKNQLKGNQHEETHEVRSTSMYSW